MNSRTFRVALVTTLVMMQARSAARDASALRPRTTLTENEIVERGLVLVRLDPKVGALPGECDDIVTSDLAISVGRRPARVTAVERIPRPLRHWLLVDISESAEGRRAEAKRSAEQYVREVMTPGVDVASVVSIDEDAILVQGPSDDPEALAQAIERVPSGGWSGLRDGLDTVLRQVQGDRHEQLVLYWTDGEDQNSVIRTDELFATLGRAPNATVFPIALLPKGTSFPPPPLTGATFTEVAQRSGGEVLMSSDPRWLDRVRGWIGRRFVVSFVPPLNQPDDPASRRGLEIGTPQKRCQVTLFVDPFARPDPISGAAPPAPESWVRLHAASRQGDDLRCGVGANGAPWDWPLRASAEGLAGCMLDVVQSPGPYVREQNVRWSYGIQPARVVSREIRVIAPDLSQLPSAPAEAIDAIVPADGGDPFAPTPLIVEGNALLGQRARIATSLFAARPDYHAFALARLQRFAQDELRAIERDLVRAFPDLPPDKIAGAARESRAGRRAIEAAQVPTDADVVRVLSAWIRDVSSGDLLRDFERRLIDARIRKGKDRSYETRWAAVRARFAVPTRTRIVAPLVLLHDRVQDVVGFMRVVLPRPEAFFPPESPPRSGEERIEARTPIRPLALLLVDALFAEPEIAAAFLAREYRATSLDYEPLDPPVKHDPTRPYASAHVCLTLEGGPHQGAPAARVVLDANVTVSGELVNVTGRRASVVGDAALAALLAK